ncbi:hypothetical protein EJ07DRAFT_159331 [Lizonia empirigonia]|nr:hypothetical protein EJ07DRAFT_159331 [Lizonia empirigonia]
MPCEAATPLGARKPAETETAGAPDFTEAMLIAERAAQISPRLIDGGRLTQSAHRTAKIGDNDLLALMNKFASALDLQGLSMLIGFIREFRGDSVAGINHSVEAVKAATRFQQMPEISSCFKALAHSPETGQNVQDIHIVRVTLLHLLCLLTLRVNLTIYGFDKLINIEKLALLVVV